MANRRNVDTDTMEMPCMCDCGQWFDLHDGYSSIEHKSKVICEACHRREEKTQQLRDELYDLICEENFRALSWNQPYATLMLHGKIETRTRPTNVRGKVLICASKEYCSGKIVLDISGANQVGRIVETLNHWQEDQGRVELGTAIAVADLVGCRPMTPADSDACFVEYRDPWQVVNKKTGKTRTVQLYCWIFKNVQPIEPFDWKGSQGWTVLNHKILDNIKAINHPQ